MIRTIRAQRATVVLAAAAFALTACGSSSSSGGGTDTTPTTPTTSGTTTDTSAPPTTTGASSALCGKNLAFLGAETGDAGALGLNMVGGIKLALSEYTTAHPDCKIGLKDFDSQGDPAKAPALATQIVNDSSIFGLIGPGFSGESLATGKAFFEAGLPSISPSATNVTITQQGWTTWHRVIGNDAAQGAADAKYLMTTAAAKKVYIVDDAQDYSKGLADVVKGALGGTAVGTDEIQVGQTDMSAVVTKVKASGADALFYGGYYTEAGLLVKQLRQAGFKGTFMSGDGSEDPAFVKVAGAQAAEGAVLSAPAAPAPADFNAKYKAVNKADAGLYSTQAFDATNIFLAALDAGKEQPQDINSFIDSYSGTGASGPIAFDKNGDVTSSTIYAYLVKNGTLDTANPTAIK